LEIGQKQPYQLPASPKEVYDQLLRAKHRRDST
jgi:hypothetical protein